MSCSEIEVLLPPYVDGIASREHAADVDRHLAACAACREAVQIQRAARELVMARRDALATPAPPWLRTRLAALLHEEARRGARRAWPARAATLAASFAALVLVVLLFELVSPRSNVLYAAQLAIDHVRCLIFEVGAIPSGDAPTLRNALAKEYGWALPVPASDAAVGLTLVAARRCPIGVGPHAHLMYTAAEGHAVSLYITPNQTHDADSLNILGHAERLWTHGGHTFAMVARDLPPEAMDRISAYLQKATGE